MKAFLDKCVKGKTSAGDYYYKMIFVQGIYFRKFIVISIVMHQYLNFVNIFVKVNLLCHNSWCWVFPPISLHYFNFLVLLIFSDRSHKFTFSINPFCFKTNCFKKKYCLKKKTNCFLLVVNFFFIYFILHFMIFFCTNKE